MKLLDAGPLDARVEAHALLGRVAVREKDPVRAREEYETVLRVWSAAADPVKEIRAGWPPEDEARIHRRLGRTLNGVGEALFEIAESRRRSDVDAIVLPRHTGPASSVAVADLAARRRRAIEAVSLEYLKILQLRPVPPPSWVVAAAARVSLMWTDLVDDLGRSSGGDVQRVKALAALTDPIASQRAKPAARTCVAIAAKYQVIDARADACAAWLARTFKDEFHVVDELIPGLRASGVEPAPPLLPEP